MVSLDAAEIPPPVRTAPSGQVTPRDDNQVLAKALASLGIVNHESWAWANYKRVARDLCVTLAPRRVLEIGGGRDPLFSRDEIERLGIEMIINDISAAELAVLPARYKTACFDVAGDLSGVGNLRNSFDLAFSRMVFEHIEDGQRAWSNLYQLLAPGGVAFAFIPTFYSMPFVLNWLLPDKLAASIVRWFFPNRAQDDDPVFPARYSWCFADDKRMQSDARGDRLSRDRHSAVLRSRLLPRLSDRARRARMVHRHRAAAGLASVGELCLYRRAQIVDGSA